MIHQGDDDQRRVHNGSDGQIDSTDKEDEQLAESYQSQYRVLLHQYVQVCLAVEIRLQNSHPGSDQYRGHKRQGVRADWWWKPVKTFKPLPCRIAGRIRLRIEMLGRRIACTVVRRTA